MKDEIKEILEITETADYKRLSVDEIIVIKDYIINLQDENKRLNDYINNLSESKLIDKYINEKEYYKKAFNYVSKDALDYKLRNEKAIEMFNKETLNKYYYGMSYEFEINDFKEDMLNILQGR